VGKTKPPDLPHTSIYRVKSGDDLKSIADEFRMVSANEFIDRQLS